MPEGLSKADLDLLAKFDTPTICNVIELFDVRPRNTGYMDHRIKADLKAMTPMVGYASTATFRSDAPPAAGEAYGSLVDQVDTFGDLPGPPVVVFQDLDDPAVAATFGEVMCSTYQAFGAAGLITSGGGRDLEQVAALGFPTFTGSTICAHGYCHFTSMGTPVRVGGIVIRPGDLLHGDVNGVTTIPHEIASEVAHVSERFVGVEEIVLNYVKGGNVTRDGYAAKVEEMKAAHDVLVKELRG